MTDNERRLRNIVSVMGFLTLIFLMAYAVFAALTEDNTTYPPCEYEDSPGPCVWDAASQGNGEGQAFIVYPDGNIVYLDDAELCEMWQESANC